MAPDSLRRWAVEFLVIVFGVLVALGADAMWAERQDRGHERQALLQLLNDFRGNADRLEEFREFQLRSVRANRALLVLGGRLGGTLPDGESTELLADAVEIRTFDPVNGTLNSLLASGRLGLLRSDSLRVALAEWPSGVEDLAANERWAADYWFERTWPYLAERGVWLDALTTLGRLDSGGQEPREPELLPVVQDSIFQELLAQRAYSLQFMLADIEMVGARVDQIIRLIEHSLEGT